MSSSLTNYDPNNKRKELQENWKVPAIAQFVSLYRGAFKLPEIEIEDLEEGLIDEKSVERKILIELLVALLHGINFKVRLDNWEIYLRKIVHKSFIAEGGSQDPYSAYSESKYDHSTRDSPDDTFSLLESSLDEYLSRISQPEPEIKAHSEKFWQFDSSTQVDIIHFLCLIRLDRGDAVEAMKTMDADALRAQPLGSDDLGNEYWYFYGTRLYKQEPAPAKKLSSWEDEWNQQKKESLKKRRPGRPRKIPCKQRKSDGESDDFEDVDGSNNRRYMNIDEKSRWSVVCNTIEDWVDFAGKFKDSKSNREKALFEVVQENFLPALMDIYQEKERRLQKKLKELIPQRSPIITRRETRRHTTITHGTPESNDSESDLKNNRAHRLEERNRRAQESVGQRELRKRKLCYYDEDNDEEIPEDSEEISRSSSVDEYVQNYYPLFNEEGIDLKPDIIKLIGEVKLHKDAWPFINPVKKEEAPGYYEMISQPIDLTVISQKIFDGSYHTIKELEADFRKLVYNCRLYNGGHTGPTKMANSVFKMFQRGLTSILEQRGCFNGSASHEKETSSIIVTSKYSRTRVISKRNTRTADGKRKKRTVRHMEALETLSREAELAVEKSNNNNFLESLQVSKELKQNNAFSGLKVASIHSNPAELMERFLSDSSNQEVENVDSSDCLENESENSSKNIDASINEGSIPDHTDSYFTPHINEDNSDSSVFTDESNSKSYDNVHQTEDAATVINDSDLQARSSKNASPLISQEDNRKSSTSSSEELMHGVANILDSCNNQNMSNLISGFNRDPVYSTNEPIESPSNVAATSPHSHKSDSSSPGQARISPLNSSSFIQTSVIEKHVPFLQDSLGIPTEFGNFSTNNETSTVDASVLGFSSFPSVPQRVSPISSDLFANKTTVSPPLQVSNGMGVFTSHIASSNVPRAMAPVQLNTCYDKLIPYQNPVQIFKPEPNKFPTMKVSLPPSTGEIIVVPDKTDPNKMTFHLLAQPHSNPAQAIQSSLELRSNTSAENSINQLNGEQDEKTNKESSTISSSRRKSPSMDIPQFPNVSNGYSIMPQQPFGKNISGLDFSNLAKPVTSFPSFSSNSSNVPTITTCANNLLPMVTHITNPSALTKPDYQLIRPTSFNTQSVFSRPTNSMSFSADNNRIPQGIISQKTISSGVHPSALPTYRMANSKKRTKVDSTSVKQTPDSVQKVYMSNSPYIFDSASLVPNSNGQYEAFTHQKDGLLKTDGTQQLSRMQNSDRLFNQNAVSTAVTTASYYPSSYNNTLSTYAFHNGSLNPPIVYAQVNPSQPTQFMNIPNYMIANQNMFQPLSHPIMNVQPFQVPSRPVLSMDVSNRESAH